MINPEINLRKFKSLKPSSKWQKKTLDKLETLEKIFVTKNESDGIYKEANLFFNVFAMNKARIALFGVASVVMLSGIVGGGLFLSNYIQNLSSNSVYIVGNEREEIINNLIKNNQSGLIAQAESNQRNAGVGANKPESNLANSNLSVTTDTVKQVVDKLNYLYPDTQNKLGYSLTKNFKGAAICESYFSSGIYDNTTNEYYYYVDSMDNSTSRYEITVPTNIIIDINYSKYTANSFENIQYKGGKYAVKTSGNYVAANYSIQGEENQSDQGLSQETTIEPTTDELFKEIYGEDAQIYKRKDKNGKDAVVVENSFKAFCNPDQATQSNSPYAIQTPNYWEGESYEDLNSSQDSYFENQGDTKIVVLTWIDPVTFEMYLSESYKGSVEAANLLVGNEILEASLKEMTFNEALTITAFSKDVEIKDLGSDAYSVFSSLYNPSQEDLDKQANATVNYLKVNKINTLISADPKYDFQIYSPKVNVEQPMVNYQPEHIKDRNFYPTGMIGDKLFEEMNTFNTSNQSTLSIDTLKSGAEVQFSSSILDPNTEVAIAYWIQGGVFKNDIDNIAIISTMLFDPVVNKSIKDIKLTIEDRSIDAKVYEFTSRITYLSEGTINSDGKVIYQDKDCTSNNCTQKSFIVIFEENGYKTAFRVAVNIPALGDIAEGEYRPSNTTDAVYTKDLIDLLKLKVLNYDNSDEMQVIFEKLSIPFVSENQFATPENVSY